MTTRFVQCSRQVSPVKIQIPTNPRTGTAVIFFRRLPLSSLPVRSKRLHLLVLLHYSITSDWSVGAPGRAEAERGHRNTSRRRCPVPSVRPRLPRLGVGEPKTGDLVAKSCVCRNDIGFVSSVPHLLRTNVFFNMNVQEYTDANEGCYC